jgi:hypothetical protein
VIREGGGGDWHASVQTQYPIQVVQRATDGCNELPIVVVLDVALTHNCAHQVKRCQRHSSTNYTTLAERWETCQDPETNLVEDTERLLVSAKSRIGDRSSCLALVK